MKPSSAALAIGCLLLCGCGHNDSDQRQTTSDETSSLTARAPPSEPAEQISFKQSLSRIYLRDKALYDAAPNDGKDQVQDRWSRDFCSFMTQHQSFTGWTGTVEQLSDPNLNLTLDIDIGGGLRLMTSDPANNPSLDNSAKVISKMNKGDGVVIEGRFGQGLFNYCDSLPEIRLSDGTLAGAQLPVILTKLDDASAAGPPKDDYSLTAEDPQNAPVEAPSNANATER